MQSDCAQIPRLAIRDVLVSAPSRGDRREDRRGHFFWLPTSLVIRGWKRSKREVERERETARWKMCLYFDHVRDDEWESLKVPKHEIFDSVFLHKSSLIRP